MLRIELGEKPLGSLKGEHSVDLLSLSALQVLLNLHGNVGIMASFITLDCHAVRKKERQAKFTGSIIITVFLV